MTWDDQCSQSQRPVEGVVGVVATCTPLDYKPLLSFSTADSTSFMSTFGTHLISGSDQRTSRGVQPKAFSRGLPIVPSSAGRTKDCTRRRTAAPVHSLAPNLPQTTSSTPHRTSPMRTTASPFTDFRSSRDAYRYKVPLRTLSALECRWERGFSPSTACRIPRHDHTRNFPPPSFRFASDSPISPGTPASITHPKSVPSPGGLPSPAGLQFIERRTSVSADRSPSHSENHHRFAQSTSKRKINSGESGLDENNFLFRDLDEEQETAAHACA